MDFLLVAVALVSGLVGAGTGYALVRRDMGARRAWLVAAVGFVALGAGWLAALYGAVLALVAAVPVYLLTRSRIGADRALFAAGGSYVAIVTGCTVLLYASLETM